MRWLTLKKDSEMDIHRLMVYVATLILLVAMAEYMLRPGDDVLVYIIATILGFLFGKATNGIGKGGDEKWQ
jgi:uncharacterized membrane protein required for colicin V production